MSVRRKIILRSSWRSVNIGDIAHTPGLLRLLELSGEEIDITLWPCDLGHGAREMLKLNFPRLKIVEGRHDHDVEDPEVSQAFKDADFFLHGSGPGVNTAALARWKKVTGKPYGMYGVGGAMYGHPYPYYSMDANITEEEHEILNGASFIFCRETTSLEFFRRCGVNRPKMGFGPDATFAARVFDPKSAGEFMRRTGLPERKFVGMIPRLRFTPPYPDSEEGRMKQMTVDKFKDADMEKLRAVAERVLEKSDLSILICPEETYEVELGKELALKLSGRHAGRIVWRDSYWRTDEATSVYQKMNSLVSFEMHSPILCSGLGVPAVYLQQPTDTCKGQMWRDIGLSDWIFKTDETSADTIADTELSIVNDYSAALKHAEEAQKCAESFMSEALGQMLESIRRS